MMAQYDLQGKEGTTWDGAGDVDPTCIAPDGKTVDVKKSKSLRTSDLFTRN